MWDSPVDDQSSVISGDYLGSECQMLDDDSKPWLQGFIRIDMCDGTTGRMAMSDFEGAM